MKFRSIILVIALLLAAVPSWAQYSRAPRKSSSYQAPNHKVELLGFGGYLWSGSQDAWYGNYSGEIDLKDSAVWGIEADINVRPGAQLVLLYHRQDTELMFRSVYNDYSVGNVAVEHWHIGGMSGIQKGNVMPFGMVTLGGTRIIPQYPDGSDDVWKFSVLFGLGAKFYVNERVGFRVQGLMPWIVLDGGGGVACGGGGCYTSFGGYRIVQGEVSGGLFLMF